MTNSLEELLTAGMRDEVAGITITTDIVGETLRVQRRHTMIVRIGYAVGVVGLAGALTAGVLATGGTKPGPTPGRPPVAGAQSAAGTESSADVRLAAVVTASQSTSYKVKTTFAKDESGKFGPMLAGLEGAIDPASNTGYLRQTFAGGGWYEQRLIHGAWYDGNGTADGKVTWIHNPGNYKSLAFTPKIGVFSGDVSADPQAQLDALKQRGAKISQTDANTYHFEVTLPANITKVGDVTVGADQRVSKVVYKVTEHSTKLKDPSYFETMQFSDYGAPVTVDRPVTSN